MGRIFLVLCILGNFVLYPEYFEDYVEDSILSFRKVLIFFFCQVINLIMLKLQTVLPVARNCSSLSLILLSLAGILLMCGSGMSQRLRQSLYREFGVSVLFPGLTPHSALGFICWFLCQKDSGFSIGILGILCFASSTF